MKTTCSCVGQRSRAATTLFAVASHGIAFLNQGAVNRSCVSGWLRNGRAHFPALEFIISDVVAIPTTSSPVLYLALVQKTSAPSGGRERRSNQCCNCMCFRVWLAIKLLEQQNSDGFRLSSMAVGIQARAIHKSNKKGPHSDSPSKSIHGLACLVGQLSSDVRPGCGVHGSFSPSRLLL